MTNVCKSCFADKELIGFITAQSKFNNCNFCSAQNVECLAIEELYGFFDELFRNFRNEKRGQPLKSKIQGNWSLFSSLQSAYSILNHVLAHIATPFSNADDTVEFSEDVLENINYWDILKRQLFEETRYITNITYLTEDLGWDGFFGSQIELAEGQELFRARIHYQSEESAYNNLEMFCPPREKATAGRANPSGIPFLYLSDRQDTVLYEIRAAYLDEVSIGTFVLKEKLSHKVFISDFTEAVTIFHPSKVGERIKSTLLKQKISADLSKPMRRYDSEIEYIPTQFICEFIKIFTGVQGIKFRSSLHTLGNNIVIFNQDIMQCTKVEKVKVNRVIISL